MKRILCSMVCGLLWASHAQAQVCVGEEDATFHAGGDASFSSSSRNVTAGVKWEHESFFVRGGLAVLSISGVSAGTGFIAGGGAKFEVGTDKRFQVCPTVNVVKLGGVDPGDGSHIAPFGLSFGATVGFEATKINTTRIVPMVGIFFDRLTSHFGGSTVFGGTTAVGSESSSSGALQFGAGIIFNDKMSLVPSLIVPFSAENSEILFSVLFSLKVR